MITHFPNNSGEKDRYPIRLITQSAVAVVYTLPTDECSGHDTKQSDGEVPVMLELWGIRSTPSLLSLPGPLWPGVVTPDSNE